MFLKRLIFGHFIAFFYPQIFENLVQNTFSEKLIFGKFYGLLKNHNNSKVFALVVRQQILLLF